MTTLKDILDQIHAGPRPPDKIAVSFEDWERIRGEVTAISLKNNPDMPAPLGDPNCPYINFLCRGVPIVVAEIIP